MKINSFLSCFSKRSLQERQVSCDEVKRTKPSQTFHSNDPSGVKNTSSFDVRDGSSDLNERRAYVEELHLRVEHDKAHPPKDDYVSAKGYAKAYEFIRQRR